MVMFQRNRVSSVSGYRKRTSIVTDQYTGVYKLFITDISGINVVPNLASFLSETNAQITVRVGSLIVLVLHMKAKLSHPSLVKTRRTVNNNGRHGCYASGAAGPPGPPYPNMHRR